MAASVRSRTWPTRWCSSPPTRPASSPAPACPSTAAWASEREDWTMSTDKPVIVYGASGYTGRLICEYLREYNVPFVAAGRDKARIQEVLDKVPGIDTVEHEIVEVAHDVAPLTELFAGAQVVLNTVGPFAQCGREVVEACIKTGCHYLDTTGEQGWLIVCDEEYGERMAAKGLLLAPGIAQMYTT